MSLLSIEDHPGGVRVLALDRAPVNAFDLELMKAVSDAFREADAAPGEPADG